MRILSFLFTLPFVVGGLSSCTGYTIVGCNHQLSSVGRSIQAEGIYLDFIDHDELGIFTSALVYELEKHTLPIQTTACNTRYVLQVSLYDEHDENIGFSFAQQQTSDKVPRHFIVADEGRLSLSVRVQLKDMQTGALIVDQRLSKEFVSFDFEPDLGTYDEQTFALGQYEMHNEALKNARRVLYARAAKAVAQQVYYDLI